MGRGRATRHRKGQLCRSLGPGPPTPRQPASRAPEGSSPRLTAAVLFPPGSTWPRSSREGRLPLPAPGTAPPPASVPAHLPATSEVQSLLWPRRAAWLLTSNQAGGEGVTLPKHPPPSWGPPSRLLPGRPSQGLGSRPQVGGPTAKGPSHRKAWPSSACSGFRRESPFPTPAQPPLTGFPPRTLQPTVSPGPLMTGAREHGWLTLVPALLPRGGPWC